MAELGTILAEGTGIELTDDNTNITVALNSGSQTSLNKADSAIQPDGALSLASAVVKLVYRDGNSRWEFPDGSVPTLTGRTASIMWEGTSAQIPSQGTGDSDFQEGDTALVRETTL